MQLQLDSEPAGDQLNSAYGSMKEAMRTANFLTNMLPMLVITVLFAVCSRA